MITKNRIIVVPKDDTPFTVKHHSIVRLIGTGIAGSRIKAKIDGPARIQTVSSIMRLAKGRPVIGMAIKQYDLKPVGVGTVTVTITVTPPQPGASPKITKFTFNVER